MMKIDHSFFEDLTSEHTQYVLGYLCIGLEQHLRRLGLIYHYRYDMQRKDKIYYRVNIHRKLDILRVYDILYADATIYLLRKRNVFQKWLQKTLNIGESPVVGNAETQPLTRGRS